MAVQQASSDACQQNPAYQPAHSHPDSDPSRGETAMIDYDFTAVPVLGTASASTRS
jgi:hypothetical protein